MHTFETKKEFLKLRSFGWSFARISRQIGVSKPTLIAWSRIHCDRLRNETAAEQDSLQRTFDASREHALAILTARLDSVRQELFSRNIQSVPTPRLESLAAELERRIAAIQEVKNPNSSSQTTVKPNQT